MMSKPVLVQLVQKMVVGGLEAMVMTLGDQLERDYQVHYLSLEGDKQQLVADWPVLGRLQRFETLAKPQGVSVSTVVALRQWLRRHRVQYLHTHHVGPLLYGGAASVGLGISHVHTHHDGWSLAMPRVKMMTRSALRLFAPISVADAPLVADQFRQAGCRIDCVVNNGIAMGRFTPGNSQRARRHFGLPLDVDLVGTVCRLEKIKRVDRLIRALVALPERVHLVVAGEGSERVSLEQLARQLGVQQRCHFLGRVDDVHRLYRALNLFGLVSDNEGAPMSLLEAQACGVPVIASDVGNCRHMVCTNMGRMVALGAQSEVIDGIDQLLRRRDRHPAKLRQFVRQTGSDRVMANHYHTLFQRELPCC
ncbi:glycosyltransferase [Ferrimonas kyonanensis]|uniref:glycosyltransferase n=1 Tax=Ferrimonas kyonanensis TaxID=364763 RepID=UPI0003F87EAD|nr:glycosyltransferase [Ferrimonas kyonanensis]